MIDPLRTAFFRLALTAAALISGNLAAVELTAPPKVEVAEKAATIEWKTDVASGSRVNFSTREDMLDQRADGEVSATHTVTLTDLQPGTTYYYAVGSARTKLATGSFTTTGDAPAGAKPTAKPKVAAPGKPKPAPLPTTAPPTRVTWGYMPSLQDHYDRHGRDFKCTSPDDYAAKAWLFLQRAKAEGLSMKLDDDGTVRVWDGATRSFAAYNRNGTTKTYFRPNNPLYWTVQPGRKIKPAELPFK
jgi:pyocin large subunit-like protein